MRSTADRADYSARRIPLGGDDVFAAYDNPFTDDKVRGHVWRADGKAKGQILFCPGFTEFAEKYAHVAARLVASGYDVFMIDWPGQGRSGHFGTHPEHIHLLDFDTYMNALEAFMTTAGLRDGALLMGHSMGGHLALRAAQRYPKLFSRVVLSAPMIRPKTGPTSGVRLLAWLLSKLGLVKIRAPFQVHLSAAIARQAGSLNPLTHDAAFYDLPYQIYDEEPAMRRSVPTVGWVGAAYRSCAQTCLNAAFMKQIQQPVLALLAGQDYVVSTPIAKASLQTLPNVDIEMVAGTRHEILNETPEIQADVWPKILHFFEMAD